MIFTHPGRLGDLLWALPTIEAMRKIDPSPVALYVSKYCEPLVRLLGYKYEHVEVLDSWDVEFSAPVKPWKAPLPDKHQFRDAYHLGLRQWPSPTLLEYYPRLMFQEYNVSLNIDPNQPWLANVIEPSSPEISHDILIAFSDEYVEQKVGYLSALRRAFPKLDIALTGTETSRLYQDFMLPKVDSIYVADVYALAKLMPSARVVITCNSMPHPLASSLGCRTIIIEPNPMRHQAVFKAPIKRNTYIDSVNSFELIDAVKAALDE